MKIRNILERRLAAVLFFAISTISAAAQSTVPAPDIGTKVDDYMNALVKIKGVGGSVLIASGGKVLVSRGYGPASVEAKTENAPATRFRIGSLTKQFTAAAIMLLQERGKLAVTDKACQYLADCPDAWKTIKIHELLTHTAGVPNFTALPEWKSRKSEALSPVQVAALVRGLPLKFEPGTEFDYSNTGYLLLGLIIEKISGKTYADFMKANIFDQLKMTDSGYDDGKPTGKNVAAGYTRKGDAVVPAAVINMMAPFAAGALYSTVDDMYRWSQALDTEKLLSRKSLDAIFTPEKKGYGYGWGIGKWNGRTLQSHTGAIDGFSSYIARFSTEHAVVIVLINNDTGVANIVGNDLQAILYGEKYELPRERKVVSVDAKILDTYAGKYEVAPGFAFTIAKVGDHLTFQPPGQGTVELFAETETSFFLKVVEAQIVFTKDESGKVTGMEFRQLGRSTKAKRVEP